MGVELILMLIVVIVVIGIDSIYSYLSNKKAIKIIEEIQEKINKHIEESKMYQETLIKHNEENLKIIVGRVNHENNNLKYLKDNIYLFHKETDETLKRIEDKINDTK